MKPKVTERATRLQPTGHETMRAERAFCLSQLIERAHDGLRTAANLEAQDGPDVGDSDKVDAATAARHEAPIAAPFEHSCQSVLADVSALPGANHRSRNHSERAPREQGLRLRLVSHRSQYRVDTAIVYAERTHRASYGDLQSAQET